MLEWSVSLERISVGSDGTAHVLIRFIPSAPLIIIHNCIEFNIPLYEYMSIAESTV